MAPYMSFPGCLGLLDSGSCLAKISQIRHFKGEQDGRQTPRKRGGGWRPRGVCGNYGAVPSAGACGSATAIPASVFVVAIPHAYPNANLKSSVLFPNSFVLSLSLNHRKSLQNRSYLLD
jgi:hypothetical protein